MLPHLLSMATSRVELRSYNLHMEMGSARNERYPIGYKVSISAERRSTVAGNEFWRANDVTPFAQVFNVAVAFVGSESSTAACIMVCK